MISNEDKYLIKTNRLILKVIQQQDLQFVFKALSDKKVTKYYGVSFNCLEETKEQMNWYDRLLFQKRGLWWKIIHKETENPIGACGFNDWDHSVKKVETGFWLLPEFWGNGFMREAMSTILKYGFNEMNMEKITAEAEANNKASIKLLKKLGFNRNGQKTYGEIKNGKEIEVEMFELVNPGVY